MTQNITLVEHPWFTNTNDSEYHVTQNITKQALYKVGYEDIYFNYIIQLNCLVRLATSGFVYTYVWTCIYILRTRNTILNSITCIGVQFQEEVLLRLLQNNIRI